MASDEDGRVALITMAHDYVGPALAEELVRTGHRLVLHDAPPALVERLESLGGRVVCATGDLSTQAGNVGVIRSALDAYGRIDAACFLTGRIVVGKFLSTTIEQWELVKRANLDMVFHALSAVLPPMLSAGQGQVLVFTSAAGARPEPGVSAYASTRAGANALVRAVGLEHAASGVQVNAIGTNYMDFPGFIAATGSGDPERRKKIESQVPMRRLGSMQELAAFASIFLDGRARFQTGQFFSFSGGWSP